MARLAALRSGAGRFASAIAILGLLIVAVMLTSADERSFMLEAQTSGVRLTFHGEANAWNIEEATLCLPRAVPQPRLAAGDGADEAVCAPTLFETRAARDLAISWRAGSTVDLVIDTAGALSVRVVEGDQPELAEGAFVVIPAATWARHGALTFAGALRVGDTIASGARNYLRSGRWEVRQGGLATSLFRDAVEVSKRGDFTLGASVEVFSGDRPATLYGSITPADAAAFHLVALSQRGPVELRLGHFGLREATVLRPDWIDRVTSSSTLIALIALMTFVATGYQIILFARISDLVAREAPRRRAAEAASGREPDAPVAEAGPLAARSPPDSGPAGP